MTFTQHINDVGKHDLWVFSKSSYLWIPEYVVATGFCTGWVGDRHTYIKGGGELHLKPKLSISFEHYLIIINTLVWKIVWLSWSKLSEKLKMAIEFLRGTAPLGNYFWRLMCIFSKNKATLDKVSYGSGQKFSKELKNHSFTSVETIVVKLCVVAFEKNAQTVTKLVWGAVPP